MAGAQIAVLNQEQTPELPDLDHARVLFSSHMPCEPVELRRVYLRLALKHHPDKRPESDRVAATRLFQAIASIYEELSHARSDDGSVPNQRVKSQVAAAAELGEVDELRELLLANRKEANRPDERNVYPIMFAALGGSIAAAEILLEFGADLHTHNWMNWSVLMYAALRNHGSMVRFLVARGAKVTDRELCITAWTGNPDSLATLLDLYDGSASDLRSTSSGKTLLHLACEGMGFLKSSVESHAKCVTLALDRNVPVDAVEPEKQQTCLHLYVGHKNWKRKQFEDSAVHMNVLELLCDRGAGVSVEDSDGRSAMSMAAESGLARVRQVLFAYL